MNLVYPTIIIVTGRPAAGKSTLAKWLSQQFQIPLVSKDSVREQLFDCLGWKDREWAQILGKTSVDMMFYFARASLKVGSSIIMDNAFDPVLSVPRFQALKNQYKAKSIQIICDAENGVLYKRFKLRFESGNRHPGHGDEVILDHLHEFLAADSSSFLDIGDAFIRVDTNDFSKVNYQEILKQIRDCLESE